MAGRMKHRAKDLENENSSSSFPRVKKYLTQESITEQDESLTSEAGSNLDLLLPRISVHDDEKVSLNRRVRSLNDLAKVIRHAGGSLEVTCRMRVIMNCLRLALLSRAKEIRAGAMRVLRYILTTPTQFGMMLEVKVDLLVARSLDTPPVRDIERLQAMRFIRQVMGVCPAMMPRTLIAPLVSIVVSEAEPADNLIWSSLATLCEIVLILPDLACQCGVVKALLRGLLKCQMPRISESIILTLTYLLNQPESRKYVRSHLDMESLLAPITDLHYHFHADDVDTALVSTRSDKELRVESAKMALVSMLKSWPGMLSLCCPNSNGSAAFVNMLPLVESTIQREMMEVLYNVFQLKIPAWTEDYRAAVASVEPAQYCDNWSLEYGWVAEEALALLPPKVMERTELLDCYHSLLLASLIKAGIVTALVGVIRLAEGPVSVMATILTGELLHLTNNILPPEYYCPSLSLPKLVASAMAFDSQTERNRASQVINCLDRVHQLKKQQVKPASLYLKLTLEQAGYSTSSRKISNFDKELMNSVHIPNEMDEPTLSGLIKDSLMMTNRDFSKWKWNLVTAILQHPYLPLAPFAEDSICTKFIRTLVNFYKPSSRQFYTIQYSEANAKKYSAAGLELIKFLNHRDQGLLQSLVTEIVEQLGQVTASKLTSDVFSPANVTNKMARDYFLFLGSLSYHNSSLLQQCKAYGPLLDISGIVNRHVMHKLIVASLDFAHDTNARVVLSRLLTAGDKDTRLYTTRHMRVFLRANVPLFISWGLEMLTTQLYDTDREVAEEAIDILDEACEEESFLEALVVQQPALLHLSDKGDSLLTRFFSVKRGYSLLSRLGHLHVELDRWFESGNHRYVSVVEERLAQTLTSYQHTKHGQFVRRSDNSNCYNSQKVFVPVHLYGQLVRQSEGCKMLKQTGHIKKLVEFLMQEPCSPEKVHQTKSAIWAMGHIGTASGGLSLLIDEDIIHTLVVMAETSPVLSIKGTCFYALCLISKTTAGADALLDLGWTSVRHSRDEKWPVMLEELVEDFSGPTSSSPFTSPSTSLSSLGSQTSGDDPSPTRQPQKQLSGHRSQTEQSERVSPQRKETRDTRRLLQRRAPSLMLRNLAGTGISLRDKQFKSYTLGQTSLSSSDLGCTSPLASPHRTITRHSSLSRPSCVYAGIALPLELCGLFQYEECEYKGSRADSVSTHIFNKDHHFLLSNDTRRQSSEETRDGTNADRAKPCDEQSWAESDRAEMSRCHQASARPDITINKELKEDNDHAQHSKSESDGDLQRGRTKDRIEKKPGVNRSPSPLVRQSRLRSEGQPPQDGVPICMSCDSEEEDEIESKTEEEGDGNTSKDSPLKPQDTGTGSSTRSQTSDSSGSSIPSRVDEQSEDGLRLLHRQFLEVVYCLCSNVSFKKNTQHLNVLCERFPSVCQDVSLYWKTMEMLSLYQYSLASRRFIQSKFELMTFESLFPKETSGGEKSSVVSAKSLSQDYIDSSQPSRRNLSPLLHQRRKSAEDMNTLEVTLKPEDSQSSVSADVSETTGTPISTDTTSMTSGEVDSYSLGSREDIKNCGTEGQTNEREDSKLRTKLKPVAETGNRLSQLQVPEYEGTATSLVDVCYDL